MILILADRGRREKRVKTLTGNRLLVNEDTLNLRAAETIKTLLAMKGIESALARDSGLVLTDEDYQAIKGHYNPEKEIFVTCRSAIKTKKFLVFRLCNFSDNDDLLAVTTDFEITDRVSNFLEKI